jgi:hypothetical protein
VNVSIFVIVPVMGRCGQDPGQTIHALTAPTAASLGRRSIM